jgi:DNA polymerase-3 subunit delta'
MKFLDVQGQDEALSLLRASLRSRHVGHAYLFHGPAGVGKTRAAIWLAAALLCEKPAAAGDACGACASCRSVAALRHPDLEVLVPLPTFRTEGRTEKQADEARTEARAAVLARLASEPYFAPTYARPTAHTVEDLARAKQFLALTAEREGGAKVLIVKGAEAMSGPAAHAFLKILEEPQPGRVLILGARQKRALLPTIASRCIHVRFRPLKPEAIASALTESQKISKAGARVLAGAAQGSLGRALALVDAPLDATTKEAPGEAEFTRLRAAALELFVRPKGPGVLRPLRQARLERDRSRFLSAVGLAILYYRDALRRQLLGEKAEIAHEDLAKQVAEDAKRISTADLTRRIRILEEIAESVRSNVTAAYAVGSAQHRMALHV